MKTIPFAEKYTSHNPISRYLVSRFIDSLSFLVHKAAPRAILEIGCGEGFLALALAEQGHSVRGIDVRKEAIDFASKHAKEKNRESQLRFEVEDIYKISADRFQEDLLVCCEVLEHLQDPKTALDCLAQLPAEYAVFSVPCEPLWRFLNLCRFKYLGSLGNTPGHVNHWSKNAFLAFVKQRYTLVEVLSPLPWTMALCRKA
ncbi:MAG: methyltransferase domain-containing protein [Synergistaceae bacterium]|jgi:SAM-dependent methyltransferase|nr:methyltransferase domain-containing protein [Synergistaceae bacterium]